MKGGVTWRTPNRGQYKEFNLFTASGVSETEK